MPSGAIVSPHGIPFDLTGAEWRYVRHALKMTGAEFAAACNCASKSAVANWEAGRGQPSPQSLRSLWHSLTARAPREAAKALKAKQGPAREAYYAQAPFTLIELLVVLSIIVVIMGIGMVTYRQSTGVDAAARMVSRQLYLARQYAVSRRCYVAVLLPDDSVTGASANLYSSSHWGRSLRVVTVDGSRQFANNITGSEWVMLPGNTRVTWTIAGDPVRRNPASVTPNIRLSPGGGDLDKFDAVVFAPSGSLDAAGDSSITIDSANAGDPRQSKIIINWLTGRAEFRRQ